MGKSPKTFWGNTSGASEKRIKVILKYVKSKATRTYPKEEPSVRMSELNDSIQSFKIEGGYNSTFAHHFDSCGNIQPDVELGTNKKETSKNIQTAQPQNISFVSKSEDSQNVICEAANEQILAPPKPPRKAHQKKQIIVKISVEEVENSTENLKIDFSNTPVEIILENTFMPKNSSRSVSNYSIDSLDDLSGLQFLNQTNQTQLDETNELRERANKLKDIENVKNNKSFLEKLDEFEDWILSRQRNNKSLKQELEEADYYLPAKHEKNNSDEEQLGAGRNCIDLDKDIKNKSKNKSLKQEFAEGKNSIYSDELKNSALERTNKSLLKEFEYFKNKVLAPTDAYYYTPQTKSKSDDEKVADIIRDLVLKRFTATRKEKSKKPTKNRNLTKAKSDTSAEFIEQNISKELSKLYIGTPTERSCNPNSPNDDNATFDQETSNLFKSKTKRSPKFAQESKISTEYETILELGCNKEKFDKSKLEYEKRTNNINDNAMQCKSILASLQDLTVAFPGAKSNKVAYIAALLGNQNQCLKEKTTICDTPIKKSQVENESCYFSCEPAASQNFMKEKYIERLDCNSSVEIKDEANGVSKTNLNGTFKQNTPVFHTKNRPTIKNIISNYNSEDLENSMSTGSEGVYDCFKNTVLTKQDTVPYFKEIENVMCQTAAGSGREATYEDIQYDSTKFLKEALGSDMEMSSDISSVNKQPNQAEPIYDRSIDTDNISTLISSGSFAQQKSCNRKLRRHFNSANTFTSSVLTETSYNDLIYEAKYQPTSSDNNIAKTFSHDSGMSSASAGIKKYNRKSLPNVAKNSKEIFSNKRQSYPLYEDIEIIESDINNTTDAQEDLLQKVAQQEELIKQAENIIENGSRRRHFYGSAAHLEAEKIRLVSSIRKNVFEKQILEERSNMSLKEEPVLAKLVIKNVSCTSSFPANEKSRKKQYFLGIFQNDTTVMCTNYMQPNMFGDVEFNGQFTFDELKSDFEIKFSLYTLAIEKKNSIAKIGCFHNSLKRNYPGKYFELVGTHKFEKLTVGIRKGIKLDNHKDYFASYKFCAISDLFIKPKEPLKGVLTIGSEIKGHPVWNSRWCVLEGTNLKLYLFPSDEFYGKPFANLDLKYCESCELDSNTGKLFKSSAIKLTFVANNTKVSKFLIADDKNQLLNWQKHIIMAQKIAKSW